MILIKQLNTLIKIIFVGIITMLFSCGGQSPKPYVSYYYWKSSFNLNASEKNALQSSSVQQFYLRYFDVVYDTAIKNAKPISAVKINQSDAIKPIVPVVFLKNQVFEKLDSLSIGEMAKNVLQLLEQINKSAKIKCRAVQVDCDWTATTQPKYFYFLKKMRELIDAHEDHSSFASMTMLTATIRLHQVKYFEKMGVPPVDKGVLMLYNMGEISTGEQNSIYDRNLSLKYLPLLHNYSLRLDVAMPIFAWGIQIRDGQIVELLNKMDERDFANQSEFSLLRPHRYKALSSFFKSGFYFKEGDEVKVEQVSENDLNNMVDDLRQYYPKQLQQIIFYDLDSLNLSRYDSSFAQKMVDRY